VPPAPVHLQPTAPLAERALLPGDPGRALALAQVLLDKPRMFNHSRGLWGYTGTAPDGALLTIQSTGLGGPSAAIVLEELCALGLRAAVRIGTCRALDGGPALGELVCAEAALACDGASAAFATGGRVAADRGLTAALSAEADHTGTVVSTDLFYDRHAVTEHRRPVMDHRRPVTEHDWIAAGALAVDLQSAAVLAVAAARGIRAGCALAVSGGRSPDAGRLHGADLEAAETRLGRAGLHALTVG
jgi:uridine phosphorylase